MEWFIELLSNMDIQNFIMTFVATYALEDGLVTLKEKLKDNSIEWQLLHCLEAALAETADFLKWEKDPDAIGETFIGTLITFHKSFNKKSLGEIFRCAVGHDVSQENINYFTNNFVKQLAAKEHTEFREYLKMKHLLNEQDAKTPLSSAYILTPNAPRWENEYILGRNDFIKELCKKLQNGIQHIQLTGMGGLGKTEIINRVYAYFANNKTTHHFDHIGLLLYDGSMDSNLEQHIIYPCDRIQDGVWSYLQNLCESKSVLLVIDDIRQQQTESMQHQDEDLSFFKLLRLKITILLASRARIPEFEEKPVQFLSTDDCIKIFQTQRYMDSHYAVLPLLSEEDKASLINIIENRAGNNTLIVSRVGVIARDHDWSASILEKMLEEKKFDIQKGSDDEEKLQNEINKLYQMDDIKKSEEKNLLEAFALIPNVSLSLNDCVQWLCDDAEIDEDACCLVLKKLARRTWLISQVFNDIVSYSMHQIVRVSVLAQSNINLDNHQKLVQKNLDVINQSVFPQFDTLFQQFEQKYYQEVTPDIFSKTQSCSKGISMRGSEKGIKAKDGTYIPVIIYNTAEFVKGVVIVNHDFGEHSGCYEEFADHLGQANYVCVVFDQRGHGSLSNLNRRGIIPSYQSFLDDIGVVTDNIKQRMPNIPLVLCGHGMGGNIAVNYLLRNNQSDFSCVLLETPWLGMYREVSLLISGLTKVLGNMSPEIAISSHLKVRDITNDEVKVEEVTSDPLYHNRISMRLFSELKNGCVYAINNASRLSVSTYLAVAEDERIVSNLAIQKFHDECVSNVTMRVYCASKHSIHNDLGRENFYQDIIAFLDVHCSADMQYSR